MTTFVLTAGAPAKPFWEYIQDMQFSDIEKRNAMEVAHVFCDGGRVHLIRMYDNTYEY